MDSEKYVVYIHKDADGNIRYVGSGRLERANKTHANSNRGKRYAEFVEKHGKLVVEIISDNLSKIDSINLELQMYQKYKSEFLLNTRPPNRTALEIPQIAFERLKYDASSPTGLIWKVDCGGRGNKKFKAGDIAGGVNSNNKKSHYIIGIEWQRFMAHRIVYALNYPSVDLRLLVVDHIDGNCQNNRIENLRAVTTAVNTRNQIKRKRADDNLPVGVWFEKRWQRYVAGVSDPTEHYENGRSKLIREFFPIKTHGSHEIALGMAIEARARLLQEINQRLNLDYTNDHGSLEKGTK